VINETKKKHKNILLLDGGDSFLSKKNVPELRAETSVEGMNLMHYDGLNIAEGELSLGPDFFKKLKKEARFPFLSANVYWKKNDQPVGQTYLIKRFDGFKVGVIGLVSPDFFTSKFPYKDDLVVKDPELTLKKILPEIKPGVDVLVLLSHLGKKATRELADHIPGIDVAIIGHDYGVKYKAELVGNTILVQNCKKGEFLGMLDLTLGQDGSIKKYENKLAALTKNSPVDPQVLRLQRKFGEKKAAAFRVKVAKKKQQELANKYRKQLNLTPEEFIKKMKEEDRLLTP